MTLADEDKKLAEECGAKHYPTYNQIFFTPEELAAYTTAVEARALAEVPQDVEIFRGAVTAMVEDGWLHYGAEGLTDAQQKCLTAYKRTI